MAIESRNVVINGNTWTFVTYSASKGTRIAKTLFSIFGPSLATLFDKDNDLDMSKAMLLLVQNIDNVSIEETIKDMLVDVRKDGKEISFDFEFSANYGTLVKLLVEIAKANFSSFFQEGGIGDLLKTMVSTPAV
jgi:hypothetical protein